MYCVYDNFVYKIFRFNFMSDLQFYLSFYYIFCFQILVIWDSSQQSNIANFFLL